MCSNIPSTPGHLYQKEVKCSAFDMGLIFHSHANKTHFKKKGCALGLILKERVLELGSGLLVAKVTRSEQTRLLTKKKKTSVKGTV